MINLEKKCVSCNGEDRTGYINGMCTDCYDLYLDIGKKDTKEIKAKKTALLERRLLNN